MRQTEDCLLMMLCLQQGSRRVSCRRVGLQCCMRANQNRNLASDCSRCADVRREAMLLARHGAVSAV